MGENGRSQDTENDPVFVLLKQEMCWPFLMKMDKYFSLLQETVKCGKDGFCAFQEEEGKWGNFEDYTANEKFGRKQREGSGERFEGDRMLWDGVREFVQCRGFSVSV